MSKAFISKKTLHEFEEQLVKSTLREITVLFDDANIECRDDIEAQASTQRRDLVRRYYASLNLEAWQDSAKLIKVFEHVLEELSEQAANSGFPDEQNWPRMACQRLEKFLLKDGLLYEGGAIRRIAKSAEVTKLIEAANKFDAQYLHTQIERMHGSVEDDPRLAIGTAKELVETTCKTILSELGKPAPKSADVIELVKLARKELQLAPDDVPDAAKAADTVKRLLSNLSNIVQAIAELRNPYGTGHGPDGRAKGLQPRHARLATGAAALLAVFLFETHEARGKK